MKGGDFMLRLKAERISRGLTQAELAKLSGTTREGYNRVENGKEKPYPIRAKRIAKALNWDDDIMKLFEEAA